MVKVEFITGRGLEFNLIILTMSLKLYIEVPKAEIGVPQIRILGPALEVSQLPGRLYCREFPGHI